MISSYVASGMRSLLNAPTFFALNVIGLAVGLAATFLVSIYVDFERSFDRFQPHTENTYRITQLHHDMGTVTDALVATYGATLQMQRIAEKMPEVQSLFSLFPLGSESGIEVEIKGEHFLLRGLFASTPNIRDFVKLNMLSGNLDDALKLPDRVALSKREAIRLFGRSEVVGEVLKAHFFNLTVAAVFDDLAPNSHFSFESLVKVDPSRDPARFWGNTYVRLASHTDVAALAEKIKAQLNAASPQPWMIGLIPMVDVHLKVDNNYRTVNICIALSLLLLTIATVNFINMSTAQAARRAKEVGVRKGLGASRLQLIGQFLFESLVIALIAAIIGMLLVRISAPWFARLIEIPVKAIPWSSAIVSAFVITVIVGVAAGFYPALFISSFNARRVLSGDLHGGGRTASIVRNCLLAIQAAFAIGLMIVTIVILSQIRYLSDLPVGYAKTSLLEVRSLDPHWLFDRANSGFIDSVKRIPGVIDAAPFDKALTEGAGSAMDIIFPKTPDQKSSTTFSAAGFNLVSTVGLELIGGRDFSEQFPGDWYHKDEGGRESASIIITESMVRMAGIETPADAVGQRFKLGINGQTTDFFVNVVGVVKDVKIGSSKDKQYPIFFICGYSWAPESTLVVHVDNQQIAAVHDDLVGLVKQRMGVGIADIRLVEDEYKNIYRYEKRQAKLAILFSGLAIILTCVGVFGLAGLSAQRRMKEVAIRKSLGASRLDILNLIAKEYLRLIGMSVLLACPIAYYVTSQWLNNFNDRIVQSPWSYLVAPLTTASIVWIAVATVAFRAASVKPALTLRYS
jgi:putative ABC transport system permease protein